MPVVNQGRTLWISGMVSRRRGDDQPERAESDRPMIRRHEEAAPPDRTRRSGCCRRQEGALGIVANACLARAVTLLTALTGGTGRLFSRRSHHHTPPPIAAA